MHRTGVELAIFRSQVRRPNHYTTEATSIQSAQPPPRLDQHANTAGNPLLKIPTVAFPTATHAPQQSDFPQWIIPNVQSSRNWKQDSSNMQTEITPACNHSCLKASFQKFDEDVFKLSGVILPTQKPTNQSGGNNIIWFIYRRLLILCQVQLKRLPGFPLWTFPGLSRTPTRNFPGPF